MNHLTLVKWHQCSPFHVIFWSIPLHLLALSISIDVVDFSVAFVFLEGVVQEVFVDVTFLPVIGIFLAFLRSEVIYIDCFFAVRYAGVRCRGYLVKCSFLIFYVCLMGKSETKLTRHAHFKPLIQELRALNCIQLNPDPVCLSLCVASEVPNLSNSYQPVYRERGLLESVYLEGQITGQWL